MRKDAVTWRFNPRFDWVFSPGEVAALPEREQEFVKYTPTFLNIKDRSK